MLQFLYLFNHVLYSTFQHVGFPATAQSPGLTFSVHRRHSPSAALGNFVLDGNPLTCPAVNFDGWSPNSVTNQSVGKVQYFSFAVPPEPSAWDLRMTNVTGTSAVTSAGTNAARLWGLLTPQYSSSWPTGVTGSRVTIGPEIIQPGLLTSLWPGAVWRRKWQSRFRPCNYLCGV